MNHFNVGDKLVAVYGSLREGFGNHRVLGESEKVVQTTLTGNYRMVSLGGFPGVLPTTPEEGTPIVVEVYRVVSEDTARRLDGLEGYRGHNDPSNFYDRQEVTLDNGMVAEMYFLSEEEYGSYEKVLTGDWKDAGRSQFI